MTATALLALVPRDGLFCKDGRGWHASASGRGHALDWPWPSTVLGSLRSAWGREEEARAGTRFGRDDWVRRTAGVSLGRTVVLRRPPDHGWAVRHRVWPTPSDALLLEGHSHVRRREPVSFSPCTLGRDGDEVCEALWMPLINETTKPLSSPRWWSEDRFIAWLAGHRVPAYDPKNTFETARRLQVHVGIAADRLTVDEGVLFSHDVVETLEHEAEWAVGAEVSLPAVNEPKLARLGSDGRLVRIEPLAEEVFNPPIDLLVPFRMGSPGLRLVAVSPLCFDRGWLPDGLEPRGTAFVGKLGPLDRELVLRAAMVPRPMHVSGWDMALGVPKSTSRMVVPGAVYFFQSLDGEPFGEEDARTLWLAALGQRTEEGFGRVVPGVWSPRMDVSQGRTE